MSATNKKKAPSPLDQTDRDLKKPYIDLNITEQSDSEECSITAYIDPTPPAQATRGLQESKTDLPDDICVNGYNVHMLHRQKLSRYRSGGIALLIRDNISSYVNVNTCSNSNLVLLFTVSKELYSSNEDRKYGIVYVPPFGSKFASNDPFFELQNDSFPLFWG